MKVIKNYQKFMLKEGVELPMTSEQPAMEQQPAPVSHSGGDMTLYRLTSHPVVDLSAPGEFYVKSMEDLNPDFLENKEGDQLFVITVTCPSSNVNDEQSETECAKHNCDCIVAVNNDSECEIVDVKPFNKYNRSRNYSEGKNFIPPLPGGGMDEEGGKQYEEEQKKKSKSQIKKESDKSSNFTKAKKGRTPIKTKK